MLTRRRSWKWSLCQQGPCVGSKISDCLGCAWMWARRGQAILPDPELIQALKLQTQELQGNYSLLTRAPRTQPSLRHTAHLKQTCLPELPLLCVLWFGSLRSSQSQTHDTLPAVLPHTQITRGELLDLQARTPTIPAELILVYNAPVYLWALLEQFGRNAVTAKPCLTEEQLSSVQLKQVQS